MEKQKEEKPITFTAARIALGTTLLVAGIAAANIALASLCVLLERRGR